MRKLDAALKKLESLVKAVQHAAQSGDAGLGAKEDVDTGFDGGESMMFSEKVKGKAMKKIAAVLQNASPKDVKNMRKKKDSFNKAKDYPQELASQNIEQHMHHLSRHPGGRKQAVAIGIDQARRGEKE